MEQRSKGQKANPGVLIQIPNSDDGVREFPTHLLLDCPFSLSLVSLRILANLTWFATLGTPIRLQ